MRVLCSHSTQVKVEREENIDICGTREISDLARPLGTMTLRIVTKL